MKIWRNKIWLEVHTWDYQHPDLDQPEDTRYRYTGTQLCPFYRINGHYAVLSGDDYYCLSEEDDGGWGDGWLCCASWYGPRLTRNALHVCRYLVSSGIKTVNLGG